MKRGKWLAKTEKKIVIEDMTYESDFESDAKRIERLYKVNKELKDKNEKLESSIEIKDKAIEALKNIVTDKDVAVKKLLEQKDDIINELKSQLERAAEPFIRDSQEYTQEIRKKKVASINGYINSMLYIISDAVRIARNGNSVSKDMEEVLDLFMKIAKNVTDEYVNLMKLKREIEEYDNTNK